MQTETRDAASRKPGDVVVPMRYGGAMRKILIVLTYKHGEGFSGIDARSALGAKCIRAILSGRMDELAAMRDEVNKARSHFYDNEIVRFCEDKEINQLALAAFAA